MLLGDLAAADLTLPDGAGAIDIRGISADSRTVGPGFLFAALPGTATDGARFAGEAVGRGAVAVLAGADARVEGTGDVPVLRADDPRRALALIAARYYPRQPEHLVAVTGTAGKTSVADFARQIFVAAGKPSASIGTLGVITGLRRDRGELTTPDVVGLHAELQRLAVDGITHVALEASSHGLDQRRLDGLRIEAAAFTNLGRDHMDYHPTVADYFAAKLRLFTDVLPAGGTAVIVMDDERAPDVVAAAEARGQRLIRVGTCRRGAAARRAHRRRVAPAPERQRLRRRPRGEPAAARRPSRRPTRWWRRASPSPPASTSTWRSTRSRACAVRAAGWSSPAARPTAPWCSSTTPTSPRRWRARSPRCGR